MLNNPLDLDETKLSKTESRAMMTKIAGNAKQALA